MGKSSPFQTMASFNGLMKARKGSQASADWVLDAVLDGIQCGFYEISDLKSSAFYGKGSSKSPDGRADLQASAARLLDCLRQARRRRPRQVQGNCSVA